MKCLLKLAVIFVLGIALLCGLAVFGLESVVSTALAEGVGYATQQETQLDGVNIGFRSQDVGFHGLTIANPPGFQATPLLTVGSIRASLEPEIMANNVVRLDEVSLDGLELALEMKGNQSNVSVLLKHFEELGQGSPSDKEPAATKPSSTETQPAPKSSSPGPTSPAAPDTEFHINRIRITGLKVSLRVSDVPMISGVYALTVPDLLLEDFGSDMDQAAIARWTSHIMGAILTRALDAGSEVFPGEWQSLLQGDLAAALLEGNLDNAKEILEGQAQEVVDELEAKASEQKDELLEQLDQQTDKVIKGLDDDLKKSLKQTSKGLRGLLGGD